jgi:hypothetical protein
MEVEGEIKYTDLVPGQRYTISVRVPKPSDLANPDLPYDGEYVDYDAAGDLVNFRNVTTRDGNEDPDATMFDPNDWLFTIGAPLGRGPPRPWPQRNIPPNTNDVVYAMEITEGMDMVDFHGEYGFGRYYPLEVYTELYPKLNPITRRQILPTEVQYYTAHIAPAGGRRRRQTKKSKRRKGVITMRQKDYLREHHHLFNVLGHPTKKKLLKELASQKKELKERGFKGGKTRRSHK